MFKKKINFILLFNILENCLKYVYIKNSSSNGLSPVCFKGWIFTLEVGNLLSCKLKDDFEQNTKLKDVQTNTDKASRLLHKIKQ